VSFGCMTDLGQRFLQRARRVRRLRLYTYAEKDQMKPVRFVVEPELLALWAATPGTLPRLQDLHIEEEYLMKSPTHEALLPNFLVHHTLLKLSLSSPYSFIPLFERNQAALIGACSELQAITLKQVGFYTDEGSDRWMAWSAAVIAHAHNVRHLHIEMPVDYAELRLLSMMPVLKTLHLFCVMNIPLLPATLPSGSFPALLNLTLNDDTEGGRLCRNVLSPCASSKLVRCAIRIYTSLLKDKCVLLAAVCQHKHVAHLLIHAWHGMDVNPAPTLQDTWLLLQELKPSRYMQSLRLTMDATDAHPLNAAHIAHVLQLYPSLRRWARHKSSQHWATMSLNEFMAVLKDRPEIRDLPITITCSDLPSADVQAAFGTHDYDMKIRILKSVFTDGLRAAIWKLFPKVSAVRVIVPSRLV
jgi:hypothetical protein